MNMTKLFQKVTKNQGEEKQTFENSGWGISCIGHSFTISNLWNAPSYVVPEKSNNTVAIALSQWVTDGKQNILMDSEPWPSNKECSHKLGENIRMEFE